MKACVVQFLFVFLPALLNAQAHLNSEPLDITGPGVMTRLERFGPLSISENPQLGGIAISSITPTTYLSGGMFALSGFVAAILGGWGSTVGAVVGGITLGVIQSFATGWLPVGYQDAIAFVVLIAVLYLRPQGLMGSPAIEGEAR